VFTPFMLLAVPIAGLMALLASRPGAQRGLPGLLAAPAVPLGVLTWINRHGPGEYCANGGCTDGYLDPRILGGVAAVFLLAGIALFLKVSQKSGQNMPVPGQNGSWPGTNHH
jgi:hypothetical protein